MGKWLVKTDPEAYSIQDLERDEQTSWGGVRNALAQQYLRQMEEGDLVLVYHSGREKQIVGLARVIREKYLDPEDIKDKSVLVDISFDKRLGRPVQLAEIKGHSKLKDFDLVRISRLSVMPVGTAHWRALMELAGEPAELGMERAGEEE